MLSNQLRSLRPILGCLLSLRLPQFLTITFLLLRSLITSQDAEPTEQHCLGPLCCQTVVLLSPLRRRSSLPSTTLFAPILEKRTGAWYFPGLPSRSSKYFRRLVCFMPLGKPQSRSCEGIQHRHVPLSSRPSLLFPDSLRTHLDQPGFPGF